MIDLQLRDGGIIPLAPTSEPSGTKPENTVQDGVLERTPRRVFLPETEAHLRDFDSAIAGGLEAHLKICQVIMILLEQPDVPSGAALADILQERYGRAYGAAYVSDHKTVGEVLIRYAGADALLACGWMEFDPAVQAARWARDQVKRSYNQFTPRELAGQAIERFAGLGRDEARALRDPSSAVKLDTKPEPVRSTYPTPSSDPNPTEPTQTATAKYTPAGTFPVAAINSYESGVRTFKSNLDDVEQRAGRTPLSETQFIERLGSLFESLPSQTVATLMRVNDSGAQGQLAHYELLRFGLSEYGAKDVAAIKVWVRWLALDYHERTLENLIRLASNQPKNTVQDEMLEKREPTLAEMLVALDLDLKYEAIKTRYRVRKYGYQRCFQAIFDLGWREKGDADRLGIAPEVLEGLL